MGRRWDIATQEWKVYKMEIKIVTYPSPTGADQSKDCMNFASYENGNCSAKRGSQFVPIGMPIFCWNFIPAKEWLCKG